MKVVCIIDDEPSVRKGLANLLKSEGYQPFCFESGASFLISPWKTQADCLLLDMRMPGLQGLEVQRLLHEQGATLPVVCMSAHASEESIQRSLDAGASYFLCKPFTAETLLQAIATTLKDRP
jgi:FixJ family two-component response regulator